MIVKDSFHSLFYPRSIAVVGASANPGKTGNYVLRSVVSSNVDKIYPIHIGGAEQILGKKAYRTIDRIPDNEVDLFLFSIPQRDVLSSFKTAIEKGCRAAVIFSSGFKEIGEAGKRDEIALREMANAAGVKIIGPNTLGFFRSDSMINGTFIPNYSQFFTPKKGVTIISQSGGVALQIINQCIDEHLPVSTMVGLGNRANVEFADLLEYVMDDQLTASIVLVIEGIEDFRHFYDVARTCAIKKPILVLGNGNTETGKKVAHSHTGSMATSGEIYKAAFQQAGLLQLDSIQEIVDALKVISFFPVSDIKQTAIVTHTAGPCILATDIIERNGLHLARLQAETKDKLVKCGAVPEYIPAQNPIDMATLGYVEPWRYLDVLQSLRDDEDVDSVLSIYMSTLEGENAPAFPVKKFTELVREVGKPTVAVWNAPMCYNDEFSPWWENDFPIYPTPERAATALVNFSRHCQLKNKKQEQVVCTAFVPEAVSFIQQVLQQARHTNLLETEAKDILQKIGVKTSGTYLAPPKTKRSE